MLIILSWFYSSLFRPFPHSSPSSDSPLPRACARAHTHTQRHTHTHKDTHIHTQRHTQRHTHTQILGHVSEVRPAPRLLCLVPPLSPHSHSLTSPPSPPLWLPSQNYFNGSLSLQASAHSCGFLGFLHGTVI